MSYPHDDADYEYDDEYDHEAGDRYADSAPLYSRRRRIILRVTVLVCVFALLLPGVLSLYSQFSAFAQGACWKAARFSDPSTVSTRVDFELFGPGGVGWECYATGASGERHVVSLGLFPSDVTPEGPTNRA